MYLRGQSLFRQMPRKHGGPNKVSLTSLPSSDAEAAVALRRDGRVSKLGKCFKAIASPHTGIELKGAVASFPMLRLLARLSPACNPPVVSAGASLGSLTLDTPPPKALRTLSASLADEPAFVAMRKDTEDPTEEVCTLDLVKLSSSSSVTPSPGCCSSTVPSSVSLPSPTPDTSRPEEAHMLSALSADKPVSVLVPDDIENRDVELGGLQKVMPAIDEPRVVFFSSSTGALVLASIMASLDFALVTWGRGEDRVDGFQQCRGTQSLNGGSKLCNGRVLDALQHFTPQDRLCDKLWRGILVDKNQHGLVWTSAMATRYFTNFRLVECASHTTPHSRVGPVYNALRTRCAATVRMWRHLARGPCVGSDFNITDMFTIHEMDSTTASFVDLSELDSAQQATLVASHTRAVLSPAFNSMETSQQGRCGSSPVRIACSAAFGARHP
ncbi:hypothetical protein B0H14DRAFT_3164572 [Mycena olivaceomarginata]|nr:hypothetical protein B0H14DRAFT_3164572 [Mycena olivaceomarginata]